MGDIDLLIEVRDHQANAALARTARGVENVSKKGEAAGKAFGVINTNLRASSIAAAASAAGFQGVGAAIASLPVLLNPATLGLAAAAVAAGLIVKEMKAAEKAATELERRRASFQNDFREVERKVREREKQDAEDAAVLYRDDLEIRANARERYEEAEKVAADARKRRSEEERRATAPFPEFSPGGATSDPYGFRAAGLALGDFNEKLDENIEKTRAAAAEATAMQQVWSDVADSATTQLAGLAADAFDVYSDALDRAMDARRIEAATLQKALRQMAYEFIRTLGRQAAVEAMMEYAYGIKDLAFYNYDAASKHFVAAGVFAAVAATASVGAGVLSTQAQASGGGRSGGGGSGGGPGGAGGSGTTVNLTIIGTLDQEATWSLPNRATPSGRRRSG